MNPRGEPLSLAEQTVYQYWITIIQLLKQGIAWDAIGEMTQGEITVVLGVCGALAQYEADQQQIGR